MSDEIDNQLLFDAFFADSKYCIGCGTGIRQAIAVVNPPFSCNCAKPPRFDTDSSAANALGGAICNRSRWLLRLTFARQVELYDFSRDRGDGTPLMPAEMWPCVQTTPMEAIALAGMHVAREEPECPP